MAELEQLHLHSQANKKNFLLPLFGITSAVLIILGCVSGFVFLLMHNKPIWEIGPLLVPLGGVVGIAIWNHKPKGQAPAQPSQQSPKI